MSRGKATDTPTDTPTALVMWTVDEWSDKITCRSVGEAEMGQWGADKYPHRFITEKEAGVFIVNRAVEKVEIAEKVLRHTRVRLVKCQKRFGGEVTK